VKKLIVQDTLVSLTRVNDDDYISLTDIARVRNPDEPKDVVKNWLRNRSTVEYLGLWEKINNAAFKGVEFDSFRLQAGSNSFTLSPNKWIEATGAIGIKSTAGRGGGTYAHRDIAFEFASWVSAEFKLYLIKEFQRLKEEDEWQSISTGHQFYSWHEVNHLNYYSSSTNFRSEQHYCRVRHAHHGAWNAPYFVATSLEKSTTPTDGQYISALAFVS